MMIFELRFLRYGDGVRTGYHIVQTVESIFPYSELGKNLMLVEYWEASGRAAKTSGLMQARTKASWHSEGPDGWCLVCRASWRNDTSSGWMNSRQMSVRTGWVDRPDGWQGIENFCLECSAESSENALNSGIPVYSIFTHMWFYPNRMMPKY